MDTPQLKTELTAAIEVAKERAEALKSQLSDQGDREAASDAWHYLGAALRALADVESAV